VDDDERDDAALTWARAAVLTVVTVVVGFLAVVVVTNVVVTKLTSVDRHVRVGLASAWFVISFAGVAWTLRRLQARHVV
jgi:hypothetical protein